MYFLYLTLKLKPRGWSWNATHLEAALTYIFFRSGPIKSDLDVTGWHGTGSSRLEVTAKRSRKRNAYIFQYFHARYNRLRISLNNYKDSPIMAEHITGVQIQSRLQHTGTWSAAACPPRRLCYRPTVFVGHCASSPRMKLQRTFQKRYFGVFTFVKLLSLELRILNCGCWGSSAPEVFFWWRAEKTRYLKGIPSFWGKTASLDDRVPIFRGNMFWRSGRYECFPFPVCFCCQ
jgi:hypothetical protein